MIIANKADTVKIYKSMTRFGGFVFICLLLLACTKKNKAEDKKIEEIIYQYPKDSLWRGIPFRKGHYFYVKYQMPSPYDSLMRDVKNILSFNYCYGVPQSQVNGILQKIQQEGVIEHNLNYGYNVNFYKKTDKDKTKYLNLSGMNLTAVPSDVAMMKNLTDLQLSDNLIQVLGPQLFFCQNLKRLDLGSNFISNIPANISYLMNLEELSLRDNKLTTLPANFNQLRNLKTLDLSNAHQKLSRSYNNFTTIPMSICTLPKLEKLLLEKLPIQSIPVQFIYLKNLKILSLNGCYGLNVYYAIRIMSHMSELQVLDISFTGTVSVPNEILLLKKLKVLIWQEEGNRNLAEIERLRKLMPDTKIYSGNDSRPFLRGNSLKTIINGY